MNLIKAKFNFCLKNFFKVTGINPNNVFSFRKSFKKELLSQKPISFYMKKNINHKLKSSFVHGPDRPL